ncbi:DNA-3-methyladenine glycosylase [Paenibacillus sp. P26]|nr:DNA-3-methyladenine glycosylase [Paenibacillus sp. P26]
MTLQPKDMPDFSFDAGSQTLSIPVPEAFSFDEALIYLTRSPLECLHQVADRKVYKSLELQDGPVLIEISEAGDSSVQLRRVDGKPMSPTAWEAAADYVRDWFDLRTELTPFYRMAETDPLLGKLAADYYGLRIIGVPDLFEALCWAVIGQQVNLAFAYTLKKRLVETYGRQVMWNGHAYWLFPQPQDIAAARVDDLRKLQFTGKKAEYVIHIAGLMESGALSKESLMTSGDFDTAERTLTSIRGIGPWTAHYVMMRCLRLPAAFPIGDAALHNALKERLNLPGKPSHDEIRVIFAPWKYWEAYAVFYLWRSLHPAAGKAASASEGHE